MTGLPNHTLSKTVSVILHPLVLPAPGLYFLFRMLSVRALPTPEFTQYAVYSIVFTGTFLMPALGIFLLQKTGFIPSLSMEKREDRRLPYLYTAICFSASYYFIQQLYLPKVVYISMLAACLSLLLTLVINVFWKISAHMVGIGGLTGLFIGVSLRYWIDGFYYIAVVVVLSGVLAWARMEKYDHSPGQVYAGYFLGMLAQLFLLLFIK